MKTKTYTLISLLGSLILLVACIEVSFSQGSLSISIDQSDGSTESLACGSFYTTLLPHEDFDANQTLKEDTWTLTNDGNDDITIQLPLTFSQGASTFLRIRTQPQAVLAPGESTSFVTSYRYNANDDGTGFLPITTDSPVNGTCGFLLKGALETASLCLCFCAGDNEISEVCPYGVDGYITGISIEEETCESNPTNLDCSSISFAGSCNCGNLTTVGDLDLYKDTLIVSGLSGTDIILTENIDSEENSFLNINAAPMRRGTLLGSINTRGIVEIPVYRRPNTPVNVVLNGVRFRSEAICPAVSDCVADQGNEATIATDNMESIPTLSEWSIILLGLILMIISLVAVRSQIILQKS